MITVVRVDRRKINFNWYIGRAWAGFDESPYHNPFHLGKDGDRETVLIKFAAYWYAPEQKWLRDQAAEIGPNDILGCWCKPLACHGDIIAGYVDWKYSQQQGRLNV